MTDHPHVIIIRLEDFDRSQLDADKRNLDGDRLRMAIKDHFEKEFQDGMGSAQIVVNEHEIILRWSSGNDPGSLADQAVNFLSNGDYERGMALLKIVLRFDPDDLVALYNLGMALSDKGQLDESMDHLRHLVELDPAYGRAWVALGVAQARKGDLQSATNSLRRAVECAPDDGYALRNLGALLIEDARTLAEASASLRKAAEILPDDQQVWINLGKLYEKTGDLDAADEAYLTVLAINPASLMAQLAKDGRSRISKLVFKGKAGGTRPDALMYCLGALEKFEGKTLAEVQKITYEIAMLGMGGLDVNNPEEQYSINSLPGKFSGLHLLCIEYVGFKKLDPTVDIGFDLSQEYEVAKQMHSVG